MRPLDGPRLMPASGNNPSHLVVFLHGYGADGNDLIGLGKEWAEPLPNVAFASPNAPEPCAMSSLGKQWFSLSRRDENERSNGVESARPALDAFLDLELERHGLSPDKLVLVGFSQGTMMALHVGLRRTVPPCAIVGFSGILVLPEKLAERTGNPPVLLLHGTHDDVLPFQSLLDATNALAEAGLPCQFHIAHRIGHGIDPEGLRHSGKFIKAAISR